MALLAYFKTTLSLPILTLRFRVFDYLGDGGNPVSPAVNLLGLLLDEPSFSGVPSIPN